MMSEIDLTDFAAASVPAPTRSAISHANKARLVRHLAFAVAILVVGGASGVPHAAAADRVMPADFM